MEQKNKNQRDRGLGVDDSDKQVDILKPQLNLLISATKLEETSENTLGKQTFLNDLKRSLAFVVYERNEERVRNHVDVNWPQFIDKINEPPTHLGGAKNI